jgi:hypothetical protein
MLHIFISYALCLEHIFLCFFEHFFFFSMTRFSFFKKKTLWNLEYLFLMDGMFFRNSRIES